ncbi:glycosyltransferase [Pseudomonas aegrilactucae]|uniref:Glycosyltransferase family 4 protein n=1 Tax=Pseudomonas aegrilactucae TaxID=2854028 RepID=A0A9Q3AE08_9PSED|nr:glycosyltransferase family 4 protein [Pseudomonas aegrilactucae]MBV6288225.1 glycosyltransferase family 4 protein [Pseudomonas aegrilactucae]
MHAPALHVLVIGYVWPEPRSSAAGGHMMQLLESFLERGWRITFSSPAAVGEHKADLASLGITEQAIALNNSSFDHFITQLAPDVVLFDRFMMEEQFGWRVEKHCPGALRVLETSDLQSLRDARQQLLRRRLAEGLDSNDFRALFTTSGPDLYRQMASADLAQRELASIYRSDLSLMISDVEIDLLVNGFGVPDALLHWCPLMLEPPTGDFKGFEQRQHFLSIGNFRHAPNWDAVLWMKHSLWPMIRRRLPKAQLHIYGAYTPPKATALHNAAEGFHVMNWAEDALQVMSEARVCLAPLRFGAGIKGKLTDAMLCGTPSVTTPIGAEAMHGTLPWPGLVADTAEGLADAAARLYSEQPRWEQAQRDARQLLTARYDRRWHGSALVERMEHTLEHLAEQRLYNFTGAMLRHHQHKSTQYMAQWIEAKNRLTGDAAGTCP